MTSNELKHQARTQEWGVAIQECRSSGLSVREWCRQRGVTTTTYYRWEREVLSSIRRKDAADRSAAVFVELPAPQPLRNVSERTVTLNLGKGSIDLYQEMSPEMLRTVGSIHKHTVFVLRAKAGPDKRFVLGEGRLHSTV